MNPQENNAGASPVPTPTPETPPAPQPVTPPVDPIPAPQPTPETPPTPEPVPQPEPTAIPAPSTEPIQAPQPVTPPAPEPNLAGSIVEGSPKQSFFKNKKAMIIIGAIIGVLAIGGIVAAVVINSINNAPDKVVFTALENFTKAKNHNIVGHIELVNNSTDDDDDNDAKAEDCVSANPVSSISIDGADDTKTVSSSTECISAESATSFEKITMDVTLASDNDANASFGVKIAATQNGKEQTFNAESVYINDGTIYIKLSDIKKSILADVADSLGDLGSIVSDIDGTWIKIDIPEIIDIIKENDRTADTATMKEAFECSVNAIKNSNSNQEKIYKTFTETQPIKTVESKKGTYSITLNADGVTKFINQTNQSGFMKDLEKCASKIDGFNLEITEVKSGDVTRVVNAIKDISVKVNKNRELTDLHVNISNENASMVADLSFTYPEKATVSAPSKSKSVVESVEEVIEALMRQQLRSSSSTIYYDYDTSYLR